MDDAPRESRQVVECMTETTTDATTPITHQAAAVTDDAEVLAASRAKAELFV
jgi:hypothetical protein